MCSSTNNTYTYDALGRLQQVKENGNMEGVNEYDAHPFRYCGEQYDNETRNLYLRARYYDSKNGRFLSEDSHWNPGNMLYGDNPTVLNERTDDPLGLNAYTYTPDIYAIQQSTNLYVYGGSNPLMFVDPTGQEWYHWAAIAGIVVVSAAAVVFTAGGSIAAGAAAVGTVASGMAAATTASTVAAGALIGSSMVAGSALLMADTSSAKNFNDSANWGTVATTAGGAVIGGSAAYATTKGSAPSNQGACLLPGQLWQPKMERNPLNKSKLAISSLRGIPKLVKEAIRA